MPPGVMPVPDRRLAGVSGLTAREEQIVWLVSHGCTTGQAARRLGVGANTVKALLRRAMVRNGASSRAHLVAMALRSRWVV